MEFCPKCGSILVMKKSRFGCPRCNYTSRGNVKIETKENIKEKLKVGVIKDGQKEALPITDYDCKKCGSKKAYFWTRESSEEGEEEIEYYKCVKCGNIVKSEG